MASTGAGAPAAAASALDCIGRTPLVRLQRLEDACGLHCELYGKCEFFNAGGSVKDRIALRMVDDAERAGTIKPGDTLIEPTSGNTGIGLALVSAVKGYRCIITLPEKMSEEKVNILKALGAEVVRTPTEAAFDSPESHIGVAKRLCKEMHNAHILDQYSNPANPLAHQEGTGVEIIQQIGGYVDAVVCGAGTGGTISGIARAVKKQCPNALIVGVDPEGSILAQPESLNSAGVQSYHVEGIGYDFIPNVLDRELVDYWVKSNDKSSFELARLLIRKEGLLVGGSSGSALDGAIQVAKKLKPGQKLVVLLPDSSRNYMSKYISDSWMETHSFSEPVASSPAQSWTTLPVASLTLCSPVTVVPTMSCQEAITVLHEHGVDQVPVVDQAGNTLGMVTEGNLMSRLISDKVRKDDPVSKAMYQQFRELGPQATLGELELILRLDHFALIVSKQKVLEGGGKSSERKVVVGIVTHIDLLHFIVSQK